MVTPGPPDIDRPGPSPAAAALRPPWLALAAAAAVMVLVFGSSMLDRLDNSVLIADRDLTPSCAALAVRRPAPPLPPSLPGLDGQFVYQTGSMGRTEFTFTAVPDADLDAVVVDMTRVLRAAGCMVTLAEAAAPPATPPRGYSQVSRRAILEVSGPAGRGTVTVAGRCATQSDVQYVLGRS